MKFEFARYKDYLQLILYLAIAAMTPVLASIVIVHLNPVIL